MCDAVANDVSSETTYGGSVGVTAHVNPSVSATPGDNSYNLGVNTGVMTMGFGINVAVGGNVSTHEENFDDDMQIIEEIPEATLIDTDNKTTDFSVTTTGMFCAPQRTRSGYLPPSFHSKTRNSSSCEITWRPRSKARASLRHIASTDPVLRQSNTP